MEGVNLKRKAAAMEPVNKTAKKNANKGKARDASFVPSPDVNRIISLNGGKHAYILNPTNGKTHHVVVDSDEYSNLVETLGLA